MSKNIQYKYADYKFTIFIKNAKWWLDFYKDKKRYKRTTRLAASKDNLVIVKKEIIPSVVEFLTGVNNNIHNKEYTIASFADEYFLTQLSHIKPSCFCV